tara:strand:- start:101 stop:562 length:462 start_codon:yes stop_codon:yes gene_type:complete
MFEPSVQAPLGLTPTNLDVRVTMRNAAAAKGEVVKFDLTASDSLVSTTVVGASDSIYANVIPATHPPTTGTIHAVCLEAITENATGKVRIRGVVDALGGDTSTIGVILTVNADGELETTSTEADTVLALALQTMANATLGSVLFNGEGFGNFS